MTSDQQKTLQVDECATCEGATVDDNMEVAQSGAGENEGMNR